MKKNLGFTLIELVIVVSILGLLVALALPAYHKAMQKANRADAKVALTSVAARMQRCFSIYNTFQTAAGKCDVKDLITGVGVTSDNKYYKVTGTIDANNAAKFYLTAVAVAGTWQYKDTVCSTFLLDSTGLKQAKDNANNDTTSDCW